MMARICAIARSSIARRRQGDFERDTEAGILLNDHIAEVARRFCAHACRRGAEGIVSKRVDGTYRSGPCPVWIKVRNPASIAVQRERSENWNS